MIIPIVGICRFSFLGLGDWTTYRRDGVLQSPTDDLLAAVSQRLYAPKRLKDRFWLFENLLLPSLRAQTDKDFTFIILTSPELPPLYMARLRDLIKEDPYVKLVVSRERYGKLALLPVLDEIAQESGGARPLQFRIDDDDCLSVDYVSTLRAAAKRMKGLKSFAISLPNTLVAISYNNDPIRYSTLFYPFHGAGCAYYTKEPEHTIFSYAHTKLHEKLPSLMIPGATSAFITRFDGHDSEGIFLRNRRKSLDFKARDQVMHIIRKRFPFLDSVDFDERK